MSTKTLDPRPYDADGSFLPLPKGQFDRYLRLLHKGSTHKRLDTLKERIQEDLGKEGFRLAQVFWIESVPTCPNHPYRTARVFVVDKTTMPYRVTEFRYNANGTRLETAGPEPVD